MRGYRRLRRLKSIHRSGAMLPLNLGLPKSAKVRYCLAGKYRVADLLFWNHACHATTLGVSLFREVAFPTLLETMRDRDVIASRQDTR